jgi:predicted nucleotidyltransferase
MNKNKNILSELNRKLRDHLKGEVQDTILFGSRSNSKTGELSDFDVLIILKNQYNWKKKRLIRDLCYEVGLKYDIFIDSKIISINELNETVKGAHPLYKDAIDKGIHA